VTIVLNDNLGSLLEAVTDVVADIDPGRVALVQGARERSWSDLDARAARLAGHLAQAGVGPGSRVGIGLYNSIEYVETLLAVFKLRAVPVNVNYRYLDIELEHILSFTDVAAVVFDASMRERMERVAPQLPSLRSLLSVGEGDDYTAAMNAPPLPRQERSVADQIIILTGGTTGKPKGVVWEHSGVRAVVTSVYRRTDRPVPATPAETVAAARQAIAEGTAPVMLPVSPLMHGTGFFYTLGNLLLGGRLVCLESRSLDTREVWSAVQEHRVEEMAIVGDAYAKPLLAELDRAEQQHAPYDITSLRRMVSSGVIWSPEVKRRLLRAGRMTLHDSIASTEGGPYGLSTVGPGDGFVPRGFTLPPNARVVTPDGTDVVPGSGQVGELASSGAMPLGYLDDPELTAAVFRVIDGVRYAVPGDAAMVEADGTLLLLGRGSGVINTGGEKVFVEEVEEALLAHPDVDDVVVVGISDERWGAQVTALVRPAPGASPSPQALREHVRSVLAGYKQPRQVFFVDTIEHTLSGKTDRRWASTTAQRLAAQDLVRGVERP
jgi:acyl-CoA synthetase (AMP-forming)/AMP-acid ligase II